MMKNYLWLSLVVAGVLSIPARANNYSINFGIPNTAGSFTYVAPPQGTGFSNFHVDWFGVPFDFTSAANFASGCGTNGPQLAFALLQQTLTACPPGGTYMWEGKASGEGGQTFVFSYTPSNLSLSGMPNCRNASNNCGTLTESGSWTVSSTIPIPEPGSFFLLAPAVSGLGLALRKRHLGKNSSATSL